MIEFPCKTALRGLTPAKATWIDFLTELDDSVEDEIEAVKLDALW